MGSLAQFTCGSCGYQVVVSGGKDYGMVAVVETMICRGCRELVDVLIGARGTEGPTGDPDYDKDLGCCPECRSKDVVPWDKSRRCPKCNGQVTEGQHTLIWD